MTSKPTTRVVLSCYLDGWQRAVVDPYDPCPVQTSADPCDAAFVRGWHDGQYAYARASDVEEDRLEARGEEPSSVRRRGA